MNDTASFAGLTFQLPEGDKVFRKKLHRFVNEIPEAVKLLPKKPEGTLVVVGACFGATAVSGLKLAGMSNLIAFEPDLANYNLLVKNVQKNCPDVSCALIRNAVGAQEGTALMTVAPVGNAGGGLVHQADTDRRGTESVVVVTLDQVMARYIASMEHAYPPVGLVWCDAQGSEPFVLAGAKSLLDGSIPWGIELAPGLMKHTLPEEYCQPLSVFDWVIDLRDGQVHPASNLRELYTHYLRTPSPNNPNKSWHTQLLCFKENHVKA